MLDQFDYDAGQIRDRDSIVFQQGCLSNRIDGVGPS